MDPGSDLTKVINKDSPHDTNQENHLKSHLDLAQ